MAEADEVPTAARRAAAPAPTPAPSPLPAHTPDPSPPSPPGKPAARPAAKPTSPAAPAASADRPAPKRGPRSSASKSSRGRLRGLAGACARGRAGRRRRSRRCCGPLRSRHPDCDRRPWTAGLWIRILSARTAQGFLAPISTAAAAARCGGQGGSPGPRPQLLCVPVTPSQGASQTRGQSTRPVRQGLRRCARCQTVSHAWPCELQG